MAVFQAAAREALIQLRTTAYSISTTLFFSGRPFFFTGTVPQAQVFRLPLPMSPAPDCLPLYSYSSTVRQQQAQDHHPAVEVS